MPVCAICGESVKDHLLHLRVDHQLQSAADYERAILEANRRMEQVKGFRAFIRELTALREAGKITAEEFRARSENWLNANSGGGLK